MSHRIKVISNHLKLNDSDSQGGVLVVGGAVNDVIGKSIVNEKTLLHTSCDGQVWSKDGGVGRNITEGIARLKIKCKMITAVGQDGPGDGLVDRLRKLNVDITSVSQVTNTGTACYQCIVDSSGQLVAAIADMKVFNHITSKLINDCLTSDYNPSIVVFDGNICSSKAVETLLNSDACRSAITIFEPTSVPKSKIPFQLSKSVLSPLDIITPNDMELDAIISHLFGDSYLVRTLTEKCEMVLNLGILAVVVTLGADGVFLATRSHPSKIMKSNKLSIGSFKTISIPPQQINPSEITDVTGAGDSLVAGMVAGLATNHSLHDAVIVGTHAARSTLKSPLSVSSDILTDCSAYL